MQGRGGGGGGIFSWEVAGIPLHALCLVSIQSVSICAVCIMCVHACVQNWDKLCTYEGWQLSEYAIVLYIAHLILKGRMYKTDCFL